MSLWFRYYLMITKANAEGDINMKSLMHKAIVGIWAMSTILSSIQILCLFLIESHLSKWIAASLGAIPVLMSIFIYYNMRRNLERNHVHPINGHDKRRWRVLQIYPRRHAPHQRKDSDNIFVGKGVPSSVMSRWD